MQDPEDSTVIDGTAQLVASGYEWTCECGLFQTVFELTQFVTCKWPHCVRTFTTEASHAYA